MSRFTFLILVATLLLLTSDASAAGRRQRYSNSGEWYPAPAASSPASGYSYRAYSYQTRENRPIAVQRAPYSIESNVWRADRKMLQTYWYRD